LLESRFKPLLGKTKKPHIAVRLEKIKIFNDPEYRSIPVRDRIAMNYIDNFRAEEFTAMADLIDE
jgi:hypothetical protein